jgi:hypothetical protein
VTSTRDVDSEIPQSLVMGPDMFDTCVHRAMNGVGAGALYVTALTCFIGEGE